MSVLGNLENWFLNPNRPVREGDSFQSRATLGPNLKDVGVYRRYRISPMVEIWYSVYVRGDRTVEVDGAKLAEG